MAEATDSFLILHVDDDQSMLELSATFLQRADDRLQIETAFGPTEGLERLQSGTYDAIISDYQMPGMDGLEFLETVRNELGSEIPFIIFTGKGRKEVAIDALNLGANRYLQKGGDPSAQYAVLADAVVQEVEHARARASLQESESKYRSVYENAPLAFVIWDRDRTIVDWNEQAADLFGWSHEAAVGEDIGLFIPDDQMGELESLLTSLLTDPEPAEYVNENLTKDGDRIWCHWYNAPVEDDGGISKVISLALDITDSREREAELQRYGTAVESSDDSIYMLDTERRYLFANGEHLTRLAADGKIERATEDAVVGKRYAAIHSESEADRITPLLVDAIESGEPRTEEYEFLTEEKWSYRTYSPVPDPTTGEITGVVVISKDITKRKRAETREAFLNSLLRHDLRNKIQIALGYHDLLAERQPQADTDCLNAANGTLTEGLDLIEKIGLLSKLENGDVGTDDRPLTPALEAVIESKRPHAEEAGITVEYMPYGGDDANDTNEDGTVHGGPLLEELFSNLLENAIIHADARRIRVSVTGDTDGVTVHIEDDGVGVPEESAVMELFERGFSAGDEAGSGLGLYLVKQIVERYGGSVAITDSDLGGMGVDVWLPRGASEPEST